MITRAFELFFIENSSCVQYQHINHFVYYASIVDYRNRMKNGLVFTSNLAESTVESLINRRCKGQQHMRWSREGLDPLLQIRAALNSKGEWDSKWKTAILNAV